MTVTESSNPTTSVAHHLPLRVLQETKQVAKSDTQVAFQFSIKFKHCLFQLVALRCAWGISQKTYTEKKKIQINFSSYILSISSWFLILTSFLHVAMYCKWCSLSSQNKGLCVEVSQQKKKHYFKNSKTPQVSITSNISQYLLLK